VTTAAPASADVIRRRELAEFLRSRRERITPEQVGLPSTGRRRTPGLRREEVAGLAGVGVTWYTWLEQGRDIRASEQVLNAIARTLQLDPHERGHLFRLAGAPEPPLDADSEAITPGIRAMLTQLEPYPAVVQNARTDILACNSTYNWLLDVDSVPFADRNTLLQCFTNPEWRSRMLDWEAGKARAVAQLRAAMAGHIGEQSWKALVKRLRQEAPDFAALWSQHDVQPMRNLTKRFRHPEAGEMAFEYTHLWFGRHSELRLTTYVPADASTAAKIAER